MPDKDATARLKLDIESLKSGLREAQQDIKRANAAFKAETAGMEDWTKDADGLAAKLKNLGDVLSKQKTILSNYNTQLKKHQESQGRAAEEAESLRKQMQALAEKGVEPTSAEYKKLDKEYQAAIKSEKAESEQIRKLETSIIAQTAEINKTEAAYKKWSKAQDDLERESKSLVKTVSDQEKELKDLKKQYVEVVTSEGDTSEAAKELAGRIKSLSSDLKTNRKAIKDAEDSAERLDESYDELGKSAKDAGEDAEKAGGMFSKAKDYIIGGLAVQAITKAWDALKSAVKGVANTLADFVVDGAAFADEILTLSSQTGLATETLQEFKYMEDLVDVSSGTVAKSITRLKKQMASAQGGSKTATEAFKRLGVSYTNLDGTLRNGEDVFYDIVDALGAMENETERDALAMDLFGKSGTELNPIIEAGSTALNEFKQEAHDVGYVLDDETLEALGNTQNALDRLDKQAEGVKNQFSAGIAPAAENLATTLTDTLGNVRTQRAITVLSDAVGGFLDSLATAAADIIPAVVDAFGLFDSRLASYSDEQLERKAAADALAQSWKDTKSAFEENAGTILDNSENLQTLFDRLKDVTDETGHVQDADRELAEFIVNKLNKDLGLNIEMIDGVITGWQGVQQEIQKTIDLRTAQGLLDAGMDAYTKSLKEQEKAAQRASKTAQDLAKAQKELNEAESVHKQNLEEINDKYGSLEDAPLKVRAAYVAEGESVTKLQRKVADLTEDFSEQDAVAKEMYKNTSSYSKALTAMAQGDYKAVIDYTTRGYSVQRDFAAQSGELTKAQIGELRQAKQDQLDLISWYDEQLKKGEEGFNAEELQRYKDQYAEIQNALTDSIKAQRGTAKQGGKDVASDMSGSFKAQLVTDSGSMKETAKQGGRDAASGLASGFKAKLDDESSGMKSKAETIGKDIGDGFIKGIKSKKTDAAKASADMARGALYSMKQEARIASPSKVTEEYGEFVDLGWIKGMKNKLSLLKATARDVAASALQTVNIAQGGPAVVATQGGGTTNNFTQNIYAPKTPSRLELYRDSKNLLEMAGGIA